MTTVKDLVRTYGVFLKKQGFSLNERGYLMSSSVILDLIEVIEILDNQILLARLTCNFVRANKLSIERLSALNLIDTMLYYVKKYENENTI